MLQLKLDRGMIEKNKGFGSAQCPIMFSNNLLHIILLLHQHVLIAVQLQITLIVTEKIPCSFLRYIGVREIVKIKSFFCQANSINSNLSFRIHFCQNPSIFPQNIIDSSNVLCRVLILSIVKGIATVIRTKFLILAPQ